METYKISKPDDKLKGTIHLTASKSESNRALIIQALCKEKFAIDRLADADDTQVLKQLINSDNEVLDIGAAGTTMRFLTAFLSCKEGTRILTGSERMKQRPIKVLVDALKKLGAEIEYMEKEGFPPLRIKGRKLAGGEIGIEGNISSQYITALLLIAPTLPQGLTLNIKGPLTSRPYVNMTVQLMKHFGAKINWVENKIIVGNYPYKAKPISIEADWSAASYWYEMAALAKEADLFITGLRKNSLQGDAVVAGIYESFGISTTFNESGIHLKKNDAKHQVQSTKYQVQSIKTKDTRFKNPETQNSKLRTQNPKSETRNPKPKTQNPELNTQYSILNTIFNYDFSDCPDIAQTVVVTMAALNISGTLSGLNSLRIKETDRINALQIELSKIGIATEAGNGTLSILSNSSLQFQNIPRFKTYEDHRMAMAFAPLALKIKVVTIENPEVISKSYPNFWNDLRSTGFEIKS